MQVASRDRRISMFGDPMQDVQIDPGVGHPYQGVCRKAWQTEPGCPSSVTSASQPVE